MSLRYLTTAEAAAVLGVSKSTMHTIITDGQLRYHDVGRNGRPRIRINEDDLRKWMDARAQKRDEAS